MIYKKLQGYEYELKDVEVFEIELSDCDGNKFVQIEDGILYCAIGYMWDGPTGVPRWLHTKALMFGSLAHDGLYQLMREGLLDRKHRKHADQILRRVCIEHGMPRWQAAIVYSAVRMLAGKSVYPTKNPRGEIVEIK